MTVPDCEQASVPDPDGELLAAARAGNAAARDQLFSRHRDRLTRMVQVRLSGRLTRRIDPADVVQDALLTASQRLDGYLDDPQLPFYVWLRCLVRDRLIDAHREHVGADKRDVRRELAAASEMAAASSMALTNLFVGQLTSPSHAAVREEIREAIRGGLESLSETDREILLLRHFEQLSIEQSAQVLQISKSGANKRHLAALRSLRAALQPFV